MFCEDGVEFRSVQKTLHWQMEKYDDRCRSGTCQVAVVGSKRREDTKMLRQPGSKLSLGSNITKHYVLMVRLPSGRWSRSMGYQKWQALSTRLKSRLLIETILLRTQTTLINLQNPLSLHPLCPRSKQERVLLAINSEYMSEPMIEISASTSSMSFPRRPVPTVIAINISCTNPA